MSSLVVTMVYVMVFLSGEGLSGDQIKSDASRDYDLVNRHWLRVRLRIKHIMKQERLTPIRYNSPSTSAGPPRSQPSNSPSSNSTPASTNPKPSPAPAATPPWSSSSAGTSTRSPNGSVSATPRENANRSPKTRASLSDPCTSSSTPSSSSPHCPPSTPPKSTKPAKPLPLFCSC
jgi:hypothetical protein